jgi:hypothetical protein
MADTSTDFEKIRRNVAKMVSMNAPETDIDAYLQTERLSADEFKAVATGKAKIGDIRMTQKSQGQIARTLSAGQTIPAEGLERASLLPFSKETATGNVAFDPDAGLLGMAKRTFMTPGDVAGGRLDPESPEGARRMAEWALTVTPSTPARVTAEAVVPGTLKSLRLGEKKVPTAQELKAAGSTGFEEARNLGVDYSPEAVKSMVDDLTRSLQESGFDSITAPKTSALLAKAGAIPEAEGGAVVTSLNNLISLRKALQEAAGSGEPSERNAASRAIAALDEFISAADPSSVVAGTASAAGSVLDTARGNYAAAMRSDSVTKAVNKAERNAAKSNSGQNLDNATRQRLESILDKEARGWSKEERQLLDDIVRGKHGANVARYVGNLLGGGGGLGQALTSGLGATLGHMVGGPGVAIAGATIPPAIGVTAKQIGAKITQSQARKLDELLRMRSPLYQSAIQPTVQGLRPEVRSALGRGLMLPLLNYGQGPMSGQ